MQLIKLHTKFASNDGAIYVVDGPDSKTREGDPDYGQNSFGV
jgi:hypothetical protein